MTYLPGIKDKILNGKFRGEVNLINGGKCERVAYVYGQTLEEMRQRKHTVCFAFNVMCEKGK